MFQALDICPKWPILGKGIPPLPHQDSGRMRNFQHSKNGSDKGILEPGAFKPGQFRLESDMNEKFHKLNLFKSQFKLELSQL